MKKFTKLLGIVLMIALVMSMGTAAFADEHTITITRDTTYAQSPNSNSTGTATGNETYTYWQILKADIDTLGAIDPDTGTYAADQSAGVVAYYVTEAALATALAELKVSDTTDAAAIFTVTPVQTSSPVVRWNVALVDDSISAETLAARLLTLTGEGNPYGAGTTTTRVGEEAVVINGAADGYYLISSSLGSKLVVETLGDITIKEKNQYPGLDKAQKDTETGTYADAAVNVKVGDTIYYEITVFVPGTVSGNVTVTDTMSTGLTPGEVSTVTAMVSDTKDGTFAALEKGTDDANWSVATGTADEGQIAPTYVITIKPTAATVGKYIKFQFTAVVNSSALTESDRKNDATLTYSHYSQSDSVEYDIGAAAVIKFDGDTVKKTSTGDLELDAGALQAKDADKGIKYLEATFTLTDEAGTEIKVSEATSGTKGVYVVDPNGTSNTVVSDKSDDHKGVILIYGLDPEVTYKLTETDTEAGYNLMTVATELEVVKAEKGTPVNNTTKVVVAGVDGVSAGNANATEDFTLTIPADKVRKIENNSGTQLPSTGGIGTTIFYVVGSVLVIAAGVLLVTKKRMGRD